MDFVDTGEPEPWPDVADELAAGAAAFQGTRWGTAMRDAATELVALRKEVRYLRTYGNKDCTAMADAAMQRNELDS